MLVVVGRGGLDKELLVLGFRGDVAVDERDQEEHSELVLVLIVGMVMLDDVEEDCLNHRVRDLLVHWVIAPVEDEDYPLDQICYFELYTVQILSWFILILELC